VLTLTDCESVRAHAKVIATLANHLGTLSDDELRKSSIAHVIIGQIDDLQRSIIDILG